MMTKLFGKQPPQSNEDTERRERRLWALWRPKGGAASGLDRWP